jgi:hypothetical protein
MATSGRKYIEYAQLDLAHAWIGVQKVGLAFAASDPYD